MLTIKTNIQVVGSKLLKKLAILRDPKPLLRPVALDVLSLMTERIHEKGNAADDSPIGSYNSNYLKLRQKKPFNRTDDKKIIVSLTRRLENDWGVIATERGWAIGFLNKQKGTKDHIVSSDKMKFVEEKKNKKIASLSKSEKEYAINKIRKLVKAELDK